MRTNRNYRYISVLILAIVIYLFGVQLTRIRADACPGYSFDEVHYATISDSVNAPGSLVYGEDLLHIFWIMQAGYNSNWTVYAPIGPYPVYAMRVYTSNNKQNPANWIVLIYADKHDENILYPAFWTFGRMFDEHNNHPLCWLRMDRSEIEDALNVAIPLE